MSKQAEASGGPVPDSANWELPVLIASRNYVEAETAVDRKIAKQRYPSASNLGQRAWIRLMNGKYEAAIRDAREALDLDLSLKVARNALILANLRLGKFSAAEALATKALASDRGTGELYYARSIARARLGNSNGAAEDLASARKLEFDIGLDPAFFGLKPN